MYDVVTRYLLPGIALAIFIGAMVAIHQGAYSIAEAMGPSFTWGFIAGCGFCGALYYLIQWLERSGAD